MADINQKLPYHSIDINECINKLDSDKNGLSKKEAKTRLQEIGKNELPEKGKTNPLILFLKQFKDLLVVILVIAAIIAFIAGHYVDVYVIIGVIIINALIGFFQEYKAEKAILSLKSLVKQKAGVLRDGKKTTILSKKIVPGDIITLTAGDSVPADARIIEQKNLECTESSLTGESMPVSKKTETLEEDTNLADRKNMLYKGTHIARGSCKAVVTATATNTELGKSVILTDKTGTLTEGVLTVKKLFTPDEKEYNVEGDAYELEGNILSDNEEEVDVQPDDTLFKILTIAGYSNSASIEFKEAESDNGDEENGNKDEKEPELSGDPTELALLVLSKKAKLKEKAEGKGIKVIDDLPFNSKQKFRASLIEYEDENKREIICFGAPEKILSLSSKTFKSGETPDFDEPEKDKITEQMDAYGKEAMRVIACAFKQTGNDKKEINPGDVKDMVFAGLFGIVDPIRNEVKDAVEKSKNAGIRVIMVTGDHKNTAEAIARQAGISKPGKDSDYPVALSEEDLDVDDEKFGKYVENVNVFARVSPNTKLKILKHIQKKDHMAGMTGDGVNDAPALKAADVGFAMGQRGTDVAKDAAHVVLSDDNFATIVNAIQQGRIVFRNIRQTSFFLITTNFAATSTLIAAIALGMPVPLVATQILWVNLVTDGIMDISLATEPGSDDMMNQKPIPKKEPILNKQIFPYLFI
ncbi:MAG: HAD-IC family P-type ATPase, partial [Bacteroidales bacterium]|nr:HAD-IC family P-type ATPase [Bacteroidales bacterium]